MRIVVSQDAVKLEGVRNHYCERVGDTIGLLVEGLPELYGLRAELRNAISCESDRTSAG